ncbi:MAG: hypothetical protein EBY63_01860 [Flavobacteriia bacterium]|nr:hypothetical protein [Flavobacteriia bacterium]
MYQRLSALVFLLTFCAPFSTVGQEQPIDYTAKDSIASNVAAGTVELFNEVQISFGETQLSAGYAKIYWEEHRVEAKGIQLPDGSWTQRPVFQDGERTFYLGEIAYNWHTDKAIITQVLTQEGENFLNGQAVKNHMRSRIFRLRRIRAR